ncbi:hypothetical protein JOQ06_024369 [Pogonophryne albipinna]|uniref:Uncharacterized protein n=1 Tax=Pogonophryne albipinna TaxID=1090488 RepID=A0AAD6ACJ8_9TELE|nr:hypothetical protein JOQ06_024369 [Pogonophryne albipinna]
MADTDRHRDPHSTVERLSLNFLPPVVHRLLFSQSEEFPGGRLLLRALYGAVSGTVLFLGLCHSLPLTFDLQLAAAAVFIDDKYKCILVICVCVFVCVGVCAACCSCSSSCRCSLLLMFPSMLGTRGRAYLMLLLLTVLCRGPLSNIQSNVETAALSLCCNLDLQIHHSKQLMDDKEEFQSEVRSVSRTFQEVRDQVVRQYGYDFNRKYSAGTGSSTQDNRKYSAGTGSNTQDNRKYKAGTGSSTQDNRKFKAGTGSSTQDNRKYKAGTGSSTQEQFSSRTMMQCDKDDVYYM